MSGTGKSSALVALSELGFQVVDTDEPGWTEWSDSEDGFVWREDRVADLLAGKVGPSLYVSGTVSNQGGFYRHFDEIVLLSAPAELLLRRIEARTTNGYGKTLEQRERILRDLVDVEPLLRRTCTVEIDATRPLVDIVSDLAKLGCEPGENDGLNWPHCDGLNWPHFVRSAAEDAVLIEHGSEAARKWDPEWSCSSRSDAIVTARGCRFGRWRRSMGCIAGR